MSEASRSDPAQAPLAILGGTFDPIHNGHLLLAEDVASGLHLPMIRLIPAGDPPHRQPPGAGALDRAEMVRLAIADHPRLELDTREVDRAGRSYTFDTLLSLRNDWPRRNLALILGADAFVGLPTWHRWQELLDLAHFIVVARPGIVLQDALSGPMRALWNERYRDDAAVLRTQRAGAIVTQRITPHPIAARAIREQLARGRAGARAVSGLLPPAVLAYIRRHRIYGYSPDAS